MASNENGSSASKSAALLFLTGTGLVALGSGFAFAPQYSWRVSQIAQKAAELGFQNGVLVMGGVITFALGLVARASRGRSQTPDLGPEIEALQSETHANHEQLAAKIAQLRTSVIQVNESLGAVAAQQQAQLQHADEKPHAADHSQDAVFRLAASLDKLHAHLDERVHAVDLQMRSGFEALLSASMDVRRHLEQGGYATPPAAVPSGPTDYAPQSTGASHAQHQQHHQHASHAQHAGHGHTDHVQSHAPESGIDFFQTMEKLDAIAGDERPGAPHPHQQPTQFSADDAAASLDALLPEEYRDRY